MPVFVIDSGGKPLLPTNSARARILLRKNKAHVYSVEPFTIQLNREVENPVGEFSIGIDDGAKFVGISVAHDNDIVFAANIKLRQDVHRKMLQRSQYRRTRRSRNLRHREARFLNRGEKGWISPTIKCKKDSILRVIDDLKKRLNITNCVVEQGMFDTSSMSTGYKLVGVEYQKSEFEGKNMRQKVLWRDKYTCSHCGSKDNLHVHHIQHRSQGGTDTVSNGITLCKTCHDSLHLGEWNITKKIKSFKYPIHLQQGKTYLMKKLNERFAGISVCFGWMTKEARVDLGLSKEHYNDASAMIGASNFVGNKYLVIPRRTKIWENHPTKKCDEKNGFRHWDVIKANHKTKGIVIGSVSALKEKVMTIRTDFDDCFPVSYRKSKLLYRPKGLVYCKINNKGR
jgi:hypothetical protein